MFLALGPDTFVMSLSFFFNPCLRFLSFFPSFRRRHCQLKVEAATRENSHFLPQFISIPGGGVKKAEASGYINKEEESSTPFLKALESNFVGWMAIWLPSEEVMSFFLLLFDKRSNSKGTTINGQLETLSDSFRNLFFFPSSERRQNRCCPILASSL